MSDMVLEKLNAVRDAGTFIAFLQTLSDDLPSDEEIEKKTATRLYFDGVGGWMNQSLSSFIEAAIAGGQDNNTGVDAASPEQAWKAAAEIIYFGKVYE